MIQLQLIGDCKRKGDRIIIYDKNVINFRNIIILLPINLELAKDVNDNNELIRLAGQML